MYRTVITLPDETRDQLITLSKALGISRAELMRTAITQYTQEQLKAAPELIKARADEAIKEVENLSDLL